MHEQGLLWIAIPYLSTAAPAIPLDMITLGENTGKTVQGGQGETLLIMLKKLLNICRQIEITKI